MNNYYLIANIIVLVYATNISNPDDVPAALLNCRQMMQPYFTEPHDPHPPPTQEPVHDLSDQVEQLNAAILQTYDRLQQLRLQMRKEFVPATVCTHLEQCIKETEASECYMIIVG